MSDSSEKNFQEGDLVTINTGHPLETMPGFVDASKYLGVITKKNYAALASSDAVDVYWMKHPNKAKCGKAQKAVAIKFIVKIEKWNSTKTQSKD